MRAGERFAADNGEAQALALRERQGLQQSRMRGRELDCCGLALRREDARQARFGCAFVERLYGATRGERDEQAGERKIEHG